MRSASLRSKSLHPLFFLAALLSVAHGFTQKDWPESCIEHPTAINVQSHDYDPYEQRARTCQLKFKFYGEKKEDADSYCKEVHQDVYIKHTIDNNELTCHYERHYSCDEDQVLVNGFCYFVPSLNLVDQKKASDLCLNAKGQLPSSFESADLKHIRDYWLGRLDGSIRSVWLDQISLSKERVAEGKASSFRFRDDLGNLGSDLDVEEVEASTKRHTLCYKAARPHQSALKQYCSQLAAMSIPATFSNGMCFTISTSWAYLDKKNPNKLKEQLDKEYVDGLHKQCSWMGKGHQAAAPINRYFHEGMKKLLQETKKTKQMTILPGIEQEYVNEFNNEKITKENFGFKFFVGNKEIPGHISGFWNKEATSVANSLERKLLLFNDYEFSEKEQFMVSAVPFWVRAPVICALGIPEDSHIQATCESGFTLSYRDDGTAVCHKIVTSQNPIKKSEGVEECKKIGADPASFESHEELLHTWKDQPKQKGHEFWVGTNCAKDACYDGELTWEDTGNPVWFTNILVKNFHGSSQIAEKDRDCFKLKGDGTFAMSKCELEKMQGIICSKKATF